MAQHISQQQLESYLWGAATLLRGTIDAGDYKQFIFPLLFYKRLCDVFDEETRTVASFISASCPGNVQRGIEYYAQ
jgi:type I restriction-modification system DNA methylase subunit